MNQNRLLRVLVTETNTAVNSYLSRPHIKCMSECKKIVSGIFENTTEDEQLEIMFSIVAEHQDVFKKLCTCHEEAENLKN
jgi:hypothetical protein